MSDKPQQVPSVGRVVHYVAHGSPDGTHPTGEHRAAIITEVYGDAIDIAGIAVLNPTGMYFLRSARYDATAQQLGTWHWPEYVPNR